ncbi:MAG TPA: hypothetical protein PLH32_12020, partial [bacterium]|nr:hypothetical protein [bacterium]
ANLQTIREGWQANKNKLLYEIQILSTVGFAGSRRLLANDRAAGCSAPIHSSSLLEGEERAPVDLDGWHHDH